MESGARKRNPPTYGTAVERFQQKYTVMPDGCWLWRDGGLNKGYGQLYTGSTVVLAHRWSYEHSKGSIPEGAVIDHVCHNRDTACLGGVGCRHRRCVNPDHLEATDNLTNISRSRNHGMNKTHCKHGHEFTPENTVSTGPRNRGCRTCRLATRKRQTLERSERRKIAREVRAHYSH